MLVLGEEAQEGKLGTSLLERLHTHYYSKGEVAMCHRATLLTNYRNHNLILTLPSLLIYGNIIESRAKRRLHPRTHFPLLFVCSSVDENSQATEEDKYPQEAEIVLQQVKRYTIPWPEKEWGPQDVNEICIMTTARNQVSFYIVPLCFCLCYCKESISIIYLHVKYLPMSRSANKITVLGYLYSLIVYFKTVIFLLSIR